MKNILSLFLFFGATDAFAQPAVCDYAYMHKLGVYVYSAANKQQYLVSPRAENPAISPDGTSVSYTANRSNGDRYIVVCNLATKKKTILDTHYNNCYGAVWSPDGKMLVYNAFLSDKWTLGVIKADNTGAKLLGTAAQDVNAPVWAPDGKSIIVHDSKDLKFIDLSGHIIRTINLAKLAGGLPDLKDIIGGSSSDRFMLTADNSRIVFNSGTNETAGPDGPPDAVFVYNIASGKTMRLSPKGYNAFDVTLSGNSVLFSISKFNAAVVNVGQEDLDGKNYKLLFAGCMSVSARK
jgi:Tol biopolymer transport system component